MKWLPGWPFPIVFTALVELKKAPVLLRHASRQSLDGTDRRVWVIYRQSGVHAAMAGTGAAALSPASSATSVNLQGMITQ